MLGRATVAEKDPGAVRAVDGDLRIFVEIAAGTGAGQGGFELLGGLAEASVFVDGDADVA